MGARHLGKDRKNDSSQKKMRLMNGEDRWVRKCEREKAWAKLRARDKHERRMGCSERTKWPQMGGVVCKMGRGM